MLPPVPGGLGGLSGNQGGRYCCAEPTSARWCPDGARSGPKCGGFVVLSKFAVIIEKRFVFSIGLSCESHHRRPHSF